MFRHLILVLVLVLLTPAGHAARPANRAGAVAAMWSLPQHYRTGILRVTGDDARPNPPSWSIVARSSVRGGPTTSFRVSRGQIISQRATLNPRNLIRDFSPMALHRVRIDSDDAWVRAQRFFAARGQRLATADMELRQRGANAAPIWSLSCRQASGRRIGSLSILASTGAIVSSN